MSISNSPASAESVACQCLLEMHRDLRRTKEERGGECTLAHWRLADATIYQALKDFCAALDWKGMDDAVTMEVQSLFRQLNQAMAKQEEALLFPLEAKSSSTTAANGWSVVFGGKYSQTPLSISEQLVHLLVSRASTAARIYTVSRTPLSNLNALPPMITHLDKQNLNTEGSDDFEHIIQKVLEDWTACNSSNNESAPPITFYFTLGQHKGPDHPFQQNIHAASNFARALTNTLGKRGTKKSTPKWRVVLTGTDATLPSTSVDPVVMIQGTPTKIPSYKIFEYNFVYAASKLCQYYTVANAIAAMTDPINSIPSLEGTSSPNIVDRLRSHVMAAGHNGAYRPSGSLSMADLDAISRHWMDVAQPAIQDYMWVAPGISICYTPLHRDPWIQASFVEPSNGSPKANVLQQIIRRMKNAISIERAALKHAPPPTSSTAKKN